MDAFSALLALCAGNSPVTGEFPAQWPVTRSFDILIDLRLNKRLSKQSWSWWFETPSCSLWCHCNKNDTKSLDVKFVIISSYGWHILFTTICVRHFQPSFRLNMTLANIYFIRWNINAGVENSAGLSSWPYVRAYEGVKIYIPVPK